MTTPDPRVDSRLLGRPAQFGGSEQAWSDWHFQFRAYSETLSDQMSTLLDAAETSAVALPLATLGTQATADGKKLFFVLAMLLSGPPLTILKSVERGNGLEAWRKLCERYEGASASRLHHLLSRIMAPDPFPADAQAFESALTS